MAQRDVPEVNAGSMADIAFLLLIFFLVTTTMDKDTAYIRNIPQPIDVKEPTKVMKRNILAIKSNSNNQLMVRGEIFDNPDKISEFIIDFYEYNRKNPGVVDNNFPQYLLVTNEAVKELTTAVEDRLDQLEAQQNSGVDVTDLINYEKSKTAELTLLSSALKLYKKPIPQIHIQSNIRIEVQQSTAYSIFAKIHSEIEEAISSLRDKECRQLFNISYATLKRKYNLEKDKIDEERLSLLDILYPAKIIEVTPKK